MKEAATSPTGWGQGRARRRPAASGKEGLASHFSDTKDGGPCAMTGRATSVHFLVIAARGPTFCGTWSRRRLHLPSPHLCPPGLQWLGTRLGLGDRAACARWACERRQGLRTVTQQSRQSPQVRTHIEAPPPKPEPSPQAATPPQNPSPRALRSSLRLSGGSYPRAHVLGEGVHDAAGPHVKRHRRGLGHRFCRPQRHGRQEQRSPQARTVAAVPPSAGRRHLEIGPAGPGRRTGRGEGHVGRPPEATSAAARSRDQERPGPP